MEESESVDLNDEQRERFIAVTNGYLALCYQCGTCTSTCPWSLVREFNVRMFLRNAQLGVEDPGAAEEVWLCTTCSECLTKCPKQVKMVDVARGLRSLFVEKGQVPESIRDVLMGIYRYGNPFNKSRSERAEWLVGADVKLMTKDGADVLLHTCCASCFDPRLSKAARQMTELFKVAGIDFASFGQEESCCGDPAFNLGEFGLFDFVAEANATLFKERNVKRIVTTSPHSFNMFKNEYGKFELATDVQHYTQFLWGLLEGGKLKLTKNLEAKVTYHDPCYLGRHNGVYDAPRNILGAIPGLELVEMERVRENSLCCGGGGGRIFMETTVKERFSNLRVEEAVKTGAGILATACPYCIQNFEDSVKVLDLSDKIKVVDIAELVRMAL